MNLWRTHLKGVIIGQFWACNTERHRYPRMEVQGINPDDMVKLQPTNLLVRPYLIHVDTLLRDWECIEPVELKEYMQNNKTYAIQVFGYDLYSRMDYPSEQKRVKGQLKL